MMKVIDTLCSYPEGALHVTGQLVIGVFPPDALHVDFKGGGASGLAPYVG